jgi:orotate phosphoribosyltransferase-like protein
VKAGRPAVLTPEKLRQTRELRSAGLTRDEVARRLRISVTTVTRATSGRDFYARVNP